MGSRPGILGHEPSGRMKTWGGLVSARGRRGPTCSQSNTALPGTVLQGHLSRRRRDKTTHVRRRKGPLRSIPPPPPPPLSDTVHPPRL